MGSGPALAALLKSGERRQAEISLGHVTDEHNQILVIATIRDVTDREEARAALAVAKEKAEEALETLTKTQDELLQARKLTSLGKMVAGISHEVNTPVGVTLSSATHLADLTRKAASRYAAGELTGDELETYFADATEACRIMEVNSGKASALIHSFKQVAVDQSGGERRLFDLREYLDEIVLSLRPEIRKTKVEVMIDSPDKVEVDTYPGAVSQIVTNLLMNALIHAFDEDQPGIIRVVACCDLSGKTIHMEVSDNGKGIPAEQLPHIFDPFFTTRRGRGGSGLGMSLIYNLVTSTLSGEIKLESTIGMGTVAKLRFPVVAPERKEPSDDDLETA